MSHLKEIGTIAFDMDHMLPLIRFGTPTVDEFGRIWWSDRPRSELNVALWLATVPEIFRALAVRGVEAVFEDWRMRKADEQTRRQIVAHLSSWCYVRALGYAGPQ